MLIIKYNGAGLSERDDRVIRQERKFLKSSISEISYLGFISDPFTRKSLGKYFFIFSIAPAAKFHIDYLLTSKILGIF